MKSVDTPVLKPGKNSVIMLLPPQRPGFYVLGVLTGHIGQVRLRSHTYCSTSAAASKGGPADSDDYLSSEKPLRTVLEVSFLLCPLFQSVSIVSTCRSLVSKVSSSAQGPGLVPILCCKIIKL